MAATDRVQKGGGVELVGGDDGLVDEGMARPKAEGVARRHRIRRVLAVFDGREAVRLFLRQPGHEHGAALFVRQPFVFIAAGPRAELVPLVYRF